MLKAIDQWLPGYLRHERARARERPSAGTKHLIFALADHFEPFAMQAARAEAVSRVRRWAREYPEAVKPFRDSEGRRPQHTFFYPAEQYDAECLDMLAEMACAGCGEVEVHLHHRADTAAGLRSTLGDFVPTLREQHGLLGVDGGGRTRFGFVHGNWALCNSRPDGDWCGVNEELGVLKEAGCYADFTFPSAPSPTQPRMVNAIYYAVDSPGRPRGHDRGTPVTARRPGVEWRGPTPTPGVNAAGLMIIQGPLTFNCHRRKWGVLPRIENAAIDAATPPSPDRIDLWAGTGIGVRGRPDWVFAKVHTHGCVPANAEVLLGPAMAAAHLHLQQRYNDGAAWRLHYVTAREMYNLIKAAEAGDPGLSRDYEVRHPGRAAGRPHGPSAAPPRG